MHYSNIVIFLPPIYFFQLCNLNKMEFVYNRFIEKEGDILSET